MPEEKQEEKQEGAQEDLRGATNLADAAKTENLQTGFGTHNPVDVIADRATYKGEKITLSGNVIVNQNDVRIEANRMDLFRKKTGKTEAGDATYGDVNRIEAIGGFKYSNAEDKLAGDKGVYERDKHTITVTGKVNYTQAKGNSISGCRLIYDLKTSRAKFDGECKNTQQETGRVVIKNRAIRQLGHHKLGQYKLGQGSKMKFKNLVLKLLFSGLAIIIFPQVASAQFIPGSNVATTISADHADYRGDQTVLTGQVDVRQGDIRVLADKMTVYSTGQGSLAQSGFSRIVADGNFYYLTADQEVRGEKGVYTKTDNTFVVTGDVILRQKDGNVITGDKLYYNLDTKHARVIGSCNGRRCGANGRVNILIPKHEKHG